MPTINRILVAIDFSDHAREALAHAQYLAKACKASLELVHVVEEPLFPSIYGAAYNTAYEQPPPQVQQQAQKALSELLEQSGEAEVEHGIGYYVQAGRPSEQIVHLARQHEVDLIVLGSRGLNVLQRVVIGSVAEQVVRMAPCPVCVVKLPPDAA